MFTKLLREITVSAKAGGGDPDGNPRLRTAIENAKAQSCPKDNIERAIKKGTGELEGVDYVEVLYEAYGPGGVALMIQALTDNATRTVAEVRAKLSRGGGNLGTTNSVSFMFDRKGQIFIPVDGRDEDTVMFESKVRLPDEFAGHAMVFRTFDKVSYALVMSSVKPTRIGYELKHPDAPY